MTTGSGVSSQNPMESQRDDFVQNQSRNKEDVDGKP